MRPRILSLILVSCALACSSHKPLASMAGEVIPYRKTLRIGLYDWDKGMDRSGLTDCAQKFESISFLEEADVHRALRDSGLSQKGLFSLGDSFESYETLQGFDLLLLSFPSGAKRYLRMVNYMGRYTSIVTIDESPVSCEALLKAQRLVQIDSVPPFADISLGKRAAGEASEWLWLKDGSYDLRCTLPGSVFKPVSFMMPGPAQVLCQHEGGSGVNSVREGADGATAEEAAGSVLVYIVGVAASLAAIIVPILLFH